MNDNEGRDKQWAAWAWTYPELDKKVNEYSGLDEPRCQKCGSRMRLWQCYGSTYFKCPRCDK